LLVWFVGGGGGGGSGREEDPVESSHLRV